MSQKKARNQNFTVPNLISIIRIIIVPFFAYYFMKGNITVATVLIVLSGLSDCVDGFIARRFNQVTELGKMLDPFADKLTQGTVALCLAVKFPAICPLLILFIVKELGMLVLALVLLLSKNKRPCAAKWYGKVSTILFYISVIVIVVMSLFGVNNTNPGLFDMVSNILLVITGIMMLFSTVKYFGIFRQILHSTDPKDDLFIKSEIKKKK